MADFELFEDNGDGTVTVRRKRDGFTQAIPKATATNLANEGFLELPGQGVHDTTQAPQAQPQAAPAPQPAAPAPQLSDTIGLEVPAAAAAPQGAVPRATSVDRTGSGRMQAYGQLQQAGVDEGQALDALAATERSGASEAEEGDGVDPSSLVMAREPGQQQPAGPQYATKSRTTSTKQTEKTTGIDDEIEQIADAYEDQKAAAEEQAAVQERLATKLAAKDAVAAEANELAAADIAEKNKKHQQAQENRMAEIRAGQDEILKDAEGLKDSWWTTRNTGQKIAAVLATMFGAAGATDGHANYGMQMINKAIDDDYRGKKAALDVKRDALRGKVSFLSAADSLANNSIQRQLIHKDTALAAIQKQRDALVASAKGEAAQANLLEKTSAIDLERSKTQADLKKEVERSTVQTVSERVPIAGTNPQQMAAEMPSGNIVNPTLWNSLRDTDKQKARDTAAAYRDFIKASDRMIELRQEYKTEAFDTEAASEYEQTQNLQVGAMGQLMESGVLNEGEAERYKKALGGGMGPKLSDGQRILTAGQVDPTLNLVRGMRTTVQNKAARVGRDKWGIEISTGQAPSSFRPGI